ncbi:MAG TPA: GGDEF domain-containing protein [Aquifex aeolicus]|uniref:diguanylate cyclase n=1 Tax=Aquifex aeolicus TaxID=63363 RepID=A0A9D0YPH3_AQUAO|nr:GGDEF domain-containing protein [Aquifex aeolicus]
MVRRKVNIFGKYIFYTNLSIFSLIFLVPIGAYIITGEENYLSLTHIALAVLVGSAQVLVNRIFRKNFQNYWELIKNSLYQLSENLKKVKTLRDIKIFKRKKEELLKPLLEEESFSTLGESLKELLEEASNIIEIKLFKEEIIRRMTTTLETKKLSAIFANNIIRYFNISGIAVYLKESRGETFELKLNKGFGEINPVLGEGFIEKITAIDSILTEEKLDYKIDLGLHQVYVEKVLIHKLIPRRNKLVGIIFFGIYKNFPPEEEKLLKNFLLELEPTISLIFENALEHERSITLASFDSLTGAYNRREGLKLAKQILKRSSFEDKNACLLVLDIDFFKKINDTYGHGAGDIVLKEVATIIKNTIRNEDLIVRWGGEEFLIVLSGIPAEKAGEVAERIKNNIANSLIELPDGKKIKVTVSIGVACTEIEGTYTFDELFTIADKRLYKAKREGRNRVVTS